MDRTTIFYNWCFASTCNAGCPYCFSRDSYAAQVANGARWWSDDDAIEAWAALAEKYGEGTILFTGLEAGNELTLVGHIARYHRGILQTNLAFDVDELVRCVPPSRVSIQPTFHPHLWDMDVEKFIAKAREVVIDHGYSITEVVIVAWPPYIPNLAHWVHRLRDSGFTPKVFPCRSCKRNGDPLPAGYSQEERDTLALFVGDCYENGADFKPLNIVACGAGKNTVCVMLDGSVQRCAQVAGVGHPGVGDQNLMRDRNIVFDTLPRPCYEDSCRCEHLYRYHIYE
jgi:hypothetical protein